MKLRNCLFAMCVSCLALAQMRLLRAADLPADWQHVQDFAVAAPGLVKLDLPAETLDAARPALEDLRINDDSGGEVPYFIERPAIRRRASQNPKSFQVRLDNMTTVMTLDTGLTQPIDGVVLESPANDFIKSVLLEGTTDGQNWQTIADGRPIFRQPSGVGQLRVTFPAGVWRSLRVTVDDRRSQPVPFIGAALDVVSGEPSPTEPQPVTISERDENPGETRLTLNLGAANLNVADVEIETQEPLFTRQATLAVRQISEDSVREQTLGQGVIYRVAIEGQPPAAMLSTPLERQVVSRELLLVIRNGDSPPLPISSVRAQRHPVHLVFLARQAGAYHVLTGNGHCAAPHYDLTALDGKLQDVAVSAIRLSAQAANPNYHAPEVLPGIQRDGAALDVSAWKFRKTIKCERPGAQQLELDLDTLSHAQADFQDLRLLHAGKQVPYILDRTSISRALTPTVVATNDAKNPRLSRWIITLSHAPLPITRLTCDSQTPLFQRAMVLYEELADERGERYHHDLGSASWIQTPGQKEREFVLTISEKPQGGRVILETENGDNPPAILNNFKLYYPATRVLFMTGEAGEFFLYYGNADTSAPQYDLSLVANQLLAADRTMASLGAEETLKKASWTENKTPGSGGILFWGILAVVVVVLLAIISRLLPKTSA